MGTFEKLGILVIVVIIVMILAVAISQWGGIAEADGGASTTQNSALTVHDIDDDDVARNPPSSDPEVTPPDGPAPPRAASEWPGGIPKIYTIKENDKVWVLVVRRWGLKETFIPAIDAANPRVNVSRVRPGTKLTIPDPTPYRRGARNKSARVRGTREYEVQVGDSLERIARKHLGSSRRWPEIKLLNPGLDEKRLKPGQKLRIPAK